MSARPDLIDAEEVGRFLAFLHPYVARVTEHLLDPGCFYVFAKNPVTGEQKYEWFRIGEVARMAAYVIDLAAGGFNVWIPASTVRHGRMCSYENLVWVFALVIDFDAYGTAPFPESFAIQTSCRNGKLHAHLWFLTSLSPEHGRRFGDLLRALAKADSKTGSVTQIWRIPGTPTYKDTAEPTFKLRDWQTGCHEIGRLYPFEKLEELLPPLFTADGQSNSPPVVCRGEFPTIGRTIDEIAGLLPNLAWRYTGEGLPQFNKRQNAEGTGPSRWYHLHIAACLAFDVGLTPNEFTRFLVALAPKGHAAKFLDPRERDNAGPWELFKDIQRSREKWVSGQAHKNHRV